MSAAATAWRRLQRASLLLGLVLLSALAVAVSRLGEIERFVALARAAEPAWTGVGLLLQGGTYLAEALSWQATLRALGMPRDMPVLLRLSLAKLFSDQALPSAGLSGVALFVAALRRRGAGTREALACTLVNVVAHYAAYLACALASALILWHYNALNRWVAVMTAALAALLAAAALALPALARRAARPGSRLARRNRTLGELALALRELPPLLPHGTAFAAMQLLLLASIVVLDAATLWAMLRSLGQDAPLRTAFCAFVTGSIAATLSPIPLGLGTFEAACVAMLHALGVGVEAALMATILLRGMTVWLPMLPGLWLVRTEFGGFGPGR